MVTADSEFQATNTLGVPQRLAHLVYHCANGAASVTAYVRAPGMEGEQQFPMHRVGDDWQTDDLGIIVLPGEVVRFSFGMGYGA